jgi:hypothetical protein
METGMYELVSKIFTAVTFIAIGGSLAIVFFFMYAQVILGSKHLQHKLDSIESQLKRANELLERIARDTSGKNDQK